MLKRPGTAALLSEALAAGADSAADPCAIEGDPVEAVDVLFAIAERHGRADVHLHERGSMGAYSLDLILQRTATHGMQGKVTISHGFCLGDIAERERDALLARDGRPRRVGPVTTAPAAVPVPPVAAHGAAGVTVIGGNDGVRDTWTPYGSPDMLERAMLIGMRNDFRRDDARSKSRSTA